jgi:hypothetical protein
MWAGLLGFDGSVQLVDPVDELRVGLDELGSCLLRSFELERLAAEPGPLGFETPSVRFGRVLPGTLSGVQGGGAGRETSAAAVSGEEEIGTGPSPPVWTSSSGDYREATRDKRAIIHGGKKVGHSDTSSKWPLNWTFIWCRRGDSVQNSTPFGNGGSRAPTRVNGWCLPVEAAPRTTAPCSARSLAQFQELPARRRLLASKRPPSAATGSGSAC